MTGAVATKHNLALLIAAQILLQTTGISLIAISALLAFDLANDKSLSTLPVALGLIVSAVMMTPAALFMQRHGRKAGFLLGASAGLASAAAAWLAVQRHSFALFLLANVLFGCYQACAQYYRFAAAEASTPADRPRAISAVVAAGLLAAFTGPALARLASAGAPGFTQIFAVQLALALLALLALCWLKLPPMAQPAPGGGRPLAGIVRQPVFVAAVACSAAGYGVMAATMSATPLAMQICGYTVAGAASVIQWHMLGMFAPAFFSGGLLARFGIVPVLLAGMLALGAAVIVAVSGQQLWQFYVALTLLGMGWNFLYVGGSTLLIQAWRPGEQARVQASHDLTVFTVGSLGSFLSGRVLNSAGWNSVNLFTLPLLAVAALMLIVYWRARRTSAVAA
jgi:MFS family permease